MGIVFGVLFGKMVFGGFGRNVFNPAMVGRGFLYVSFGVQMTSGWLEPLRGFLAADEPGDFVRKHDLCLVDVRALKRFEARDLVQRLFLAVTAVSIWPKAVIMTTVRSGSWRLMVSTMPARRSVQSS